MKMNNKVVSVFAFIFGAAAGSVVTWKLLKTKYEKIAQEEIDSVKEVYSKKATALSNEVEKAHAYLRANTVADTKDRAEKVNYGKTVADLGYSAEDNKEEQEETMEDKEIYVIPPDDFGETGYETMSLTYFADKVLTDETDEPIENEEELIGKGSLNHFGEYEDDSVFVRNDREKIDFEILLDTRNYSDFIASENKRLSERNIQ